MWRLCEYAGIFDCRMQLKVQERKIVFSGTSNEMPLGWTLLIAKTRYVEPNECLFTRLIERCPNIPFSRTEIHV